MAVKVTHNERMQDCYANTLGLLLQLRPCTAFKDLSWFVRGHRQSLDVFAKSFCKRTIVEIYSPDHGSAFSLANGHRFAMHQEQDRRTYPPKQC